MLCKADLVDKQEMLKRLDDGIFMSNPIYGQTHITFVAVVGRLVLHPALVGDLFSSCHQLVPQNLDVLDGLQEAVSRGGIE